MPPICVIWRDGEAAVDSWLSMQSIRVTPLVSTHHNYDQSTVETTLRFEPAYTQTW